MASKHPAAPVGSNETDHILHLRIRICKPSPIQVYITGAYSLTGTLLQIEPEFHVGDAVVVRGGFGAFWRIIDVNNGMYVVRHTDGKYVSSFTADEIAHVDM